MNAITFGKNELGLDLYFNDFCITRQARQCQNANFCQMCSTKTKVENQVPTEQNAWPAPKSYQ